MKFLTKNGAFAIVVRIFVRQVSSSIMGMFRRKGVSGPHESYDVVGYLMGGGI